MKISIVGGHGQIALQLYPLLTQKGHSVRGLIRKEEQAVDIKDAGGEPIICDIEQQHDISEAVGAADVVIFAAGAGAGSGAERKWSVDRDGAIKLIDAAQKNGTSRYLMISAMGAEEPVSHENDVFETYLKAKAQADAALRASGLSYVIVKPGKLTNESPKKKITMGSNVDHESIPRADVARVLAALVERPNLQNTEFELISGNQPIGQALDKWTKQQLKKG